jgi:hypothetical protein
MGFYTGPALRDLDGLQRIGPIGKDGPIAYNGPPYTTPLMRPDREPYKPFFSGVDNMWEDDCGDIGSFRAELTRQFSMGVDEPLYELQLRNPMLDLVRTSARPIFEPKTHSSMIHLYFCSRPFPSIQHY